MSLKFTPGNHQYAMSATPEETRRQKVRSVTGLIGAGWPKPKLIDWSARMVAEFVADEPDLVDALRQKGRTTLVDTLKTVHTQARDTAAFRGTAVHEHAEKIVQGQAADVPEEHMPLIDGYLEWLEAFDVKFEWTERSVGNRRSWYAGRSDFRGTIGGRKCTADWKTSKWVFGDCGLQLAAYDNCEFYVNDDDPDTEYPMEPTGSLAVVHITPYETRHHWVKDPDLAWKWFQHVAFVGRNARDIDTCLGPPEPLPETEKEASA